MSDDPNTPLASPRTATWIRVLLFVSLAVNLLIAGAVAGMLLGGRPWDKSAQPPPEALMRDLGLGPYLRALRPEDRQALRQAATRDHAQLRAGRQEMRQAFTETLEVLRAEAFDETRLLGLIQSQVQVADRGRALGQRLLVERITAMSVSDRRILADRLENAVKRRGKRQGREGRPRYD